MKENRLRGTMSILHVCPRDCTSRYCLVISALHSTHPSTQPLRFYALTSRPSDSLSHFCHRLPITSDSDTSSPACVDFDASAPVVSIFLLIFSLSFCISACFFRISLTRKDYAIDNIRCLSVICFCGN